MELMKRTVAALLLATTLLAVPRPASANWLDSLRNWWEHDQNITTFPIDWLWYMP